MHRHKGMNHAKNVINLFNHMRINLNKMTPDTIHFTEKINKTNPRND